MTPLINSNYCSSALLATLNKIVFEAKDMPERRIKRKRFLRPWGKSECRNKKFKRIKSLKKKNIAHEKCNIISVFYVLMSKVNRYA